MVENKEEVKDLKTKLDEANTELTRIKMGGTAPISPPPEPKKELTPVEYAKSALKGILPQ